MQTGYGRQRYAVLLHSAESAATYTTSTIAYSVNSASSYKFGFQIIFDINDNYTPIYLR